MHNVHSFFCPESILVRMKDLILFFMLVMLNLSFAEEPCQVTYNETAMHGEIECTNCTVHILPRNDYVIELKTKRYDSYEVAINETFMENNQLQSIFKLQVAIFRRSNAKIITQSVPSSGFTLKFQPEYCTQPDLTVLEFSRKKNDENGYCNSVLQKVGESAKIIQKSRKFFFVDECVYKLVKSVELVDQTSNLYVFYKSGDFKYTIDGHTEQTSDFLRVKNWTSLILKTLFFPRSDVPQITVFAIVDDECTCDPNPIVLQPNCTTNIRSPYFKRFLCPSFKCNTRITSENDGNEDVRYLVSLYALFLKDTVMKLNSSKFDIDFNIPTIFSNTSLNFLTDGEDLQWTYSTPAILSRNEEGHYDINITRVPIERGCDCSTFMDDSYGILDSRAKKLIPERCATMYCEWNFNATGSLTSKELVMEINTLEHSRNDVITIWSHNFMEQYTGDQLAFPKKVYLPNCRHGCHVSFLRKSKGKTATFTVSWKSERSRNCNGLEHITVNEQYQTFSSPNYPKPYHANHDCNYKFETSIGKVISVHIQDIDVENAYDYLSFYDGNSTESERIAQFTGIDTEKSLNSTSNILFAHFYSDRTNENRGYSFVVHAVEQKISPTIIPTIPTIPTTFLNKHIPLLAALLIVTGVFALGSYYFNIKPFWRVKRGTEVVRFHANGDESTVTVAN